VNQPTVLILADDAEFARALVGRWQTERSVPAFAVVSSDVWNGANSAPYELAIIGAVRPGRLTSILKALDTAAKPVICVAADATAAQAVRESHPRILVWRQYEGWVENLVVLAGEILRRVEAVARARRAEQAGAASQRYASLGRYMIEMRHGFNNAMTSVLGNAELLLLDPNALTPEVRDQIETIHNMALRMHEIMQRFSSLEMELQFAEKKDSQAETKVRPAAAASND
jgi:signal transduction histidine kinase